MSLMGQVETRCPKGCEPFVAEVWSLVNGERDKTLRDTVIAGELNLLGCPSCDALFYPEVSVIYLDPKADLIAFVFPESYRSEEERWRLKMREDFEQIRGGLPGQSGAIEPIVLFGMESLQKLLEAEEDLEDEVTIARHLCREMGIELHPIEPAFAREKGLPRLVPAKAGGERGRAGGGTRPGRTAILEGLKALTTANGRLEGYCRWLDLLGSGGPPPPLARS